MTNPIEWSSWNVSLELASAPAGARPAKLAQIENAVDRTMQTPYALLFPAPIEPVFPLDALATHGINLSNFNFDGGTGSGTPRNRPTPR